MTEEFADHFSATAPLYRKARPRWPKSLFSTLARLAPGRELAIEVGCGSGQASQGLAQHFDLVLATDASAGQLAQAKPHHRIRYSQARAEQTGLQGGRADLVLAAQAAHWFELERFFAEAARLLKPGGLLVLASYAQCRLPQPDCEAILRQFHEQALEKWWPQQRASVDQGYGDIRLPAAFVPVPAEVEDMVEMWTLGQLMDYVGTWSGVNRFRRGGGEDPVPGLAEGLRVHWPSQGNAAQEVRWALTLIVGRRGDESMPAS